MSVAPRFLINDSLWQEIQQRVAKAKRVCVAVAYLGRSGAKLLALKKGDRLVVDMSLAAVRQGVTYPKAIKTLISRGVEVYTRAKLHAKLYIMDGTLIVGSMNVSDNLRTTLDEAGMMTTDQAAIRRARAFFEELCTEPVRKAYLDECIKEYRSPKFKAAVEPSTARSRKRQRVRPAKLWIIAGLSVLNDPQEANQKLLDAREKQVRAKAEVETDLSWLRFRKRRPCFDAIQVGDWVISVFNQRGGRHVEAPMQLVAPIEKWTSASGTEYEMLWLEEAPSSESMSWSMFRKKVRGVSPDLDRKQPRTRGIEDDTQADRILRLWTKTGRVSTAR